MMKLSTTNLGPYKMEGNNKCQNNSAEAKEVKAGLQATRLGQKYFVDLIGRIPFDTGLHRRKKLDDFVRDW